MKSKKEILEKLENLNDKQRRYVFIGLLVLVFVLDFFLLMQPQISMLTKIGPEIDVLKQDIGTVKENSQRINEYKNAAERLRKKVDILNLSVRHKSEVSSILETISTLASKSGVKIDEIKPDPEQQKVLLDKNNRKYYSMPINIDAESSYHNFGRFLNQLENDVISLQVSSFTMIANGSSKNHKIKMVLRTIVFEEGTKKK